MKSFLSIESIHAVEVLDSRGNPTVQVEVEVDGGYVGRAIVPSGASTGKFEAVEMRDGDKNRFNGKGVLDAIKNVNCIISKELEGENAYDQVGIDSILNELDDTPDKSNLGANAMLAVSLAVAKAAACSLGMSLYNYVGGVNGKILPIPMMNILNGGAHSDNNLSIQEFMIVPVGATSFKQCVQMCSEVYQSLKRLLKLQGYSTAVGDEGGFAPMLSGETEAIDLIIDAIYKAGYQPKDDIAIALDIASSQMVEEAQKIGEDGYLFWKTGELKSKTEMIDYIVDLVNKYPIISIEDGLGEDDWESWQILTKEIGDKVQLVGDDLFVTNVERIRHGISMGVANCVLIKPNQIGTLTETLDAIELAKSNGYGVVISHRSGETEDTTIADLAVAVNAGQIKSGAPCRTDRVAKYNRLITIEDELN